MQPTQPANKLLFWLCFILIAGMSMSVFFDFNPAQAIDQRSYIQMAGFDFDTSVHRRYRFLIPMAAAGINFLLQHVAHLFNPSAVPGDFTLRFSFYLVNLTITALWCMLIFRYCKAYGMSLFGAALGLLTVITSRYTMYLTGTPHTDILFCFAIISMLYGIKTRSNLFLMLAIVLGPFSKESFLFAAPVLLFSHMPKWKTAAWLALAGVGVLISRYVIDRAIGAPMMQSVSSDTDLLRYIPDQFLRLKTFSYWLEIYATFGLWWLLPVLQKIKLKHLPETTAYLKQPYVIAFLATSAFQIALNGEFARMMYMLMPVYAIIIGFAADKLYAYHQAQNA